MPAIMKNFRVTNEKPTKVKSKAVALLEHLKHDGIKSQVKVNNVQALIVFFSAKPHNVECPFRAIVTERGTWQVTVSRYLQRHLKTLAPEDPYKIASSDKLVEILKDKLPGGNSGFSVDIEELFHSIPQDDLFQAVRACIECSGAVAFQNASGVSVGGFLELLEVYLTSTLVKFQDSLYVQKRGICIGSSVAPVLTEIFLAELDSLMSRVLMTTA